MSDNCLAGCCASSRKKPGTLTLEGIDVAKYAAKAHQGAFEGPEYYVSLFKDRFSLAVKSLSLLFDRAEKKNAETQYDNGCHNEAIVGEVVKVVSKEEVATEKITEEASTEEAKRSTEEVQKLLMATGGKNSVEEEYQEINMIDNNQSNDDTDEMDTSTSTLILVIVLWLTSIAVMIRFADAVPEFLKQVGWMEEDQDMNQPNGTTNMTLVASTEGVDTGVNTSHETGFGGCVTAMVRSLSASFVPWVVGNHRYSHGVDDDVSNLGSSIPASSSF